VVDQLGDTQYVRTWTDEETGSQEIEAYEYAGLGEGVSIVVAWTNDESIHPLTIDVPEVELVDKGGYSWIVRDGDDQNLDGRVTWQLGPSPIFFRFVSDGRLPVRLPGGPAWPGTGSVPGR
jgi:hypothetical protein